MDIVRDFKMGMRHLAYSPASSLVAALILAVGIGAATAVFAIVDGVLIHSLPFPDPGQLVVISDVLQGATSRNDDRGVTGPEIRNYIRDARAFAHLGGYQLIKYELSGIDSPVSVNAARMSAGAFAALDVSPLLGRQITQEEDDRREPVVVLSYSTWTSRFNRNSNVLRRTILLDRKPYLIVGVMPSTFAFPLIPGHLNQVEMWVPLSLEPEELSGGASAAWNFSLIGRLRTGVGFAEARDDAARVAGETMRGFPAFMSSIRIKPVLHPLKDKATADAAPMLRTLFLAVLVVLTIACINLGGLELLRALRKRNEIALRVALGASSGDLLRQAFVESLMLTGAGGALGLVIAVTLLRTGLTFLPDTLPRVSEIGLNWPLFVFATLTTMLTGLACGVTPALGAIRMRADLGAALRKGGRSGGHDGSHARLRSLLVVSQIAVAFVLLALAGLLLRSFENMRSAPLGFRPDHTLIASYSLPTSAYNTQVSVDQFTRELLTRLQRVQSLESAGVCSFLPLAHSDINAKSAFFAERRVQSQVGTIEAATAIAVRGDYFQAVATPLLRGRLFSEADTAASPLVTIVNRTLAERTWPGQDPIGKRIRLGIQQMKTPWITVVGEVADVKETAPDSIVGQQFYQPISQLTAALETVASGEELNGNTGFIVVRTRSRPEQLQDSLRSTVSSIDPRLALRQLQTMEHALADREAPRRFITSIVSSFAAVAMLLALLGTYSSVAFAVSLRIRELAIRIAVGASRRRILTLILMFGFKLGSLGCVAGLIGAIAASRLSRSLLFGVDSLDPTVLTVAVVCTMLLACSASVLPALQAAQTDPARIIRAD